MYIDKLSIYESYPITKLIREINFHKGMNFIVDASVSDAQKGNSVGKTTVLRVIDICLGAKDRKYIYTDHEINNENIILKDYICSNKVYAELIVNKDFFDGSVKQYSFKVDLYPRGGRYIDGEKFNETEFRQALNSIIFDNNIKIPSFRQLIKMFVRIDQKEDNDKFLRYLDNTKEVQYENIYSYLFKLSDQGLSEKILKLKQEIKTVEVDIKNLKKIHNVKSINSIEQRLVNAEQEIIDLKKNLTALIDSEKFKADEKKIKEIRLIYSQTLDEINLFEFKYEKIKKTIEHAKQEFDVNINTDVLKNLYDETKSNFSDLNRTFQELILFNKQLLHNKISYFEISLQKINGNLARLNNKKEELFNQHKNIIMLIQENKVDEYTNLQNELGKITEEKGKLTQIKDVYDDLEQKLKKYNTSLKDLCDLNDNSVDTIKIFNEKFIEFSKAIIKEKYFLFLTGETFPIGIDNEKTGLSTGTKKSVIAAFDLAYQVFANRLKITCPHFIVHDVIETMDEYALNNIIKITNKINCQYIIAVLQKKIASNKLVKESDIRLVLSESEKLFKI